MAADREFYHLRVAHLNGPCYMSDEVARSSPSRAWVIKTATAMAVSHARLVDPESRETVFRFACDPCW